MVGVQKLFGRLWLEGGPGNSPNSAFHVRGAMHYGDAQAVETHFLQSIVPNTWVLTGHAVQQRDGRFFDVYQYQHRTNPRNGVLFVWFDVTDAWNATMGRWMMTGNPLASGEGQFEQTAADLRTAPLTTTASPPEAIALTKENASLRRFVMALTFLGIGAAAGTLAARVVHHRRT